MYFVRRAVQGSYQFCETQNSPCLGMIYKYYTETSEKFDQSQIYTFVLIIYCYKDLTDTQERCYHVKFLKMLILRK